jgi:hypothetical protein
MNIVSNYYSERVFAARDTSGPWHDEVKGQVSIFALDQGKRVFSFAVRFDSGGQRLAVAPGDETCFVGCYDTHGMAAYSASDGSELWRRRDLKHVQHLKTLSTGDSVFCGRESNSQVLASGTGETLARPRGARSLYASPFGPDIVIGARQFELHTPLGVCRGKIPRKTFADMACGFSPTEFAVAECSGPLRCFDLATASMVWEHQPAERSHFLGLTYLEETRCFVGWLRNVDLKLPDQLVHFASRTGAVQCVISLGTAVHGTFCRRGKAFFTDSLILISTATGEVVKRFDDPELK